MCTCVSGALVKTHVLPAVGRAGPETVRSARSQGAEPPVLTRGSRAGRAPGNTAWRFGVPWPCKSSLGVCVCVRVSVCLSAPPPAPVSLFLWLHHLGSVPAWASACVPGLASARAHLALLLAAGRVRALNAICLSVCRSQGSSRLWLTMGVVTRQGGEQSANNWLTAGHSW